MLQSGVRNCIDFKQKKVIKVKNIKLNIRKLTMVLIAANVNEYEKVKSSVTFKSNNPLYFNPFATSGTYYVPCKGQESFEFEHQFFGTEFIDLSIKLGRKF